MNRPGRVCVAGVGTEVGKTWVSARLLEALQAQGLRVAARKPVQSFDPAESVPTDAEVLAAATGEAPHDVCPAHRWYRVPMAPPMAAEATGLATFTAAELIAETSWPASADVILVETVGGVRSPLADDADSAEFAKLLAPDQTLLVADAGLGTINAVRLSLDALAGLDPIVFLNRYDEVNELHRRNLDWLVIRDARRVITTVDDLVARMV